MATYYVDGIGGKDDSGVDGSAGNPWKTMGTAFSHMKGGDTLMVRPGVYPPFSVLSALKGTDAQPTVIQAAEKWRASVRGGDPHGIVIEKDADYVIIDGFQAMGALGDGLKSYGNYAVFSNCWSHHNGSMGIGMHNYGEGSLVNGGTIDRCLIEYNGTVPALDHGIYASGDHMRISNCIVRHNGGMGMQLYGPGASFSNSVVYNNLVYNHNQDLRTCGIFIRTAPNGGNNRILNNTVLMGHSYSLTIETKAANLTEGGKDIVANNIFIAGTNFLTSATPLGAASALNLPWDMSDTAHPKLLNPVHPQTRNISKLSRLPRSPRRWRT